MRAIFLDRDGTVIVDPPDLRVDSVEKLQLFTNTIEALNKLAELDYGVFLITNQAGIAEGRITEDEFHQINDQFLKMIQPSGIKIIKTYVCGHPEGADCICRKPKPGMLLQASKEFGIDLTQSWMIGDRQSDVMAGVNAGNRTILVQTGNTPVVSQEATYTSPNLLDAVNYIASQ